LTDFFSAPTLREFIGEGPDVRLQFESLDGTERSTYFDKLILRYSFGAAGAGTNLHPLVITVKREIHEDHSDWVVEYVGGLAGPGT
jgi:hypothetical protein